jgi:hypothetical protein
MGWVIKNNIVFLALEFSWSDLLIKIELPQFSPVVAGLRAARMKMARLRKASKDVSCYWDLWYAM